MVELFCFETAHLLGDSLPASLKLRHRIFVERQRYEVSTHRGMEYDGFDTPETRYLLWRTSTGLPGAVARLIPTTTRYMIPELWPSLAAEELPKSPAIWEVSRFGVDHELPVEQRQLARAEMMCALAEFANHFTVREFLFVAHPVMIQRMLEGITLVEPLGPPQKMGRFLIAAARARVPNNALELTRGLFEVRETVLMHRY